MRWLGSRDELRLAMPAVLFHRRRDPVHRDADEANPLECSLRDTLVEQFHDHPGLVTGSYAAGATGTVKWKVLPLPTMVPYPEFSDEELEPVRSASD